jgi:hypothetical protein
MRLGRVFRATAWAIVLATGLSVCAQAIVLWRATRIEGYTFTRYHDEERALLDAQAQGESLADLFAETGLEDNTGAIEDIPNRFMLGLLPGGSGKHAISVLTLAGPGALISVIALFGLLASFRRSSPSEGRAGDSSRTP